MSRRGRQAPASTRPAPVVMTEPEHVEAVAPADVQDSEPQAAVTSFSALVQAIPAPDDHDESLSDLLADIQGAALVADRNERFPDGLALRTAEIRLREARDALPGAIQASRGKLKRALTKLSHIL